MVDIFSRQSSADWKSEGIYKWSIGVKDAQFFSGNTQGIVQGTVHWCTATAGYRVLFEGTADSAAARSVLTPLPFSEPKRSLNSNKFFE